MITTECIESFKIKKYNGCNPSALEYVNHKFYMCYPDAYAILEFDDCFQFQRKYAVSGAYFDICYDASHDCYYAIDAYCQTQIFVLDTNFCEIGKILIKGNYDEMPISIAYCNTYIYVAYETYVICLHENGKQEIFTTCKNYMISLTSTISQIGVLECIDQFYELQMFDCYGDQLERIEICRNEQICAISQVDSHIYLLCKNLDCNFIILKLAICANIDHACDCQQANIIFDSGEIEKGIACILNSEGMKIQYAIEKDASICELLKINQSVTNVINEVTQLELSLYAKLSLIINGNATCEDMCESGECE